MRGVIHDINNVLAVVLGAANAMMERAAAGASELDGHMRDHLADIVAAAERGRTMLRTALAPAEAVGAPPAAVPLDDTIRALHGNLRHLCGAVMELRLDLAAPGLHVRADRETLERVLLNLVANARDAVADGGIVTLRSAAPADASDGYAVVTIHDTGAGIPPAVLARLGESFFTTKPPDHGTGLGLATVRRLLDAVGGSFVIDSAVGQGPPFGFF